jgi:hypothetical protein
MHTSVTAHELKLIHAYNKAHYQRTYVIHTSKDSTIGGFSVEYISFDNDAATLKYANGDTFRAPLSDITIRVQF